MAKKDKTKELKQKSRFAAMEGLRGGSGGLPVPPRKAMRQARKATKKLGYPVSPYPGAGPFGFRVYGWAAHEWGLLGRHQRTVLPFVILSAILTWRKEMALREKHQEAVERMRLKHKAEQLYLTPDRPKRRKLFGFIPLPGGK
jgi:hypothetical protein